MCKKLMYLVLFVLALSLGLPSTTYAVKLPGLIGWYKLDDGAGTIVTDSSGLDNHGTFGSEGDPQWVVGIMGGALDLDGNDDYVNLDALVDDISAVRDISVAAWIKTTQTDDGTVIGGNHGNSHDFIWGVINGNHLSESDTENEYPPKINDDQWHHIAYVRDGTTMAYLYTDGVLVGTETPSGEPWLEDAWSIGQEYDPDPSDEYEGLVDDVHFFNRPLTPEEVVLVMKGAAAGVATDPQPDNEQIDVPREVILSWEAGEFAQTHKVYFGAVSEDVNNADPAVLVAGALTATSLDVGTLAFDQTYYWRVDEVNGAPDRTVYPGDVWNFTVEPLAIPVTNITATASGENPGMGPEKTIDGSGMNAMDQHSMEAGDMWLVAGAGNWIQYDFDKGYKLHEMLVWNSNQPVEAFLGFGVKEATIEYTADGETWMALDGVTTLAQAPGMATYQANTAVDMGGITATSVKLTVVSAYGTIPQSGLSEVRFMAIPVSAREPDPANGAAVDSVTVDLGWRAGREAVSHQVYLGTDAAALEMVDTTTENTATVSGLDFSTTYSWSITEVNEVEAVTTHTSEVWSFTTPDYEVIEDFDSYTDDMDAGEAIFQTWIDGFDKNDNGSLVGNDPSPFAEQTIVKSGQSMPMEYNNAGAGMSEATLDLDQDWTTSGIKTLSLAFHGAAGNTGTLYVKINNTKIPYDLAAADIATVGWQAWNIDLTAVSGLKSVRSLTIGVDGANAAGMLYIEDIRVYAQAGEIITPAMPGNTALVGYWMLDGDFQDASGNGNHGTAGGAPIFVAGNMGQAVDLGGGSDYVAIDGVADDITENIFSVCAWINTTTTGTDDHLIASNAGGDHDFVLGVGNGVLFVEANSTQTYPKVINDGEWHHIAYTRDLTTAFVYTDGVMVGTETPSGDPAGDTRWSIGQEWDSDDSSDPTDFYMGQVDDVRIYTTTLSATEVAGLAGLTAPMHKPFL